MENYNSKLKNNARVLRKNMTKEEKHLWYDFLRDYPIKFTRQKPIGNYIADFYCFRAKLVVEHDGSQHYSDTGMTYDSARNNYMEQTGLKVIRISNLDIWNNFNGVCEYIDKITKSRLNRKNAIPIED